MLLLAALYCNTWCLLSLYCHRTWCIYPPINTYMCILVVRNAIDQCYTHMHVLKCDIICSLSKHSTMAKLIKDAKLIIWDEAPMMSKACYESVDKTLRDIIDSALPFGGKVMVFGGDFRQVLPIVPRGNRAQAVDAALSRSYLWPHMRHMRLVKNMRVHRLQGTRAE